MAAAVTLTTAQKTEITLLIQYLEEGPAGKHVPDDVIAVELAKIFQGQGAFPATGKRPFYEGLRETPVSTLLRALLDVAP